MSIRCGCEREGDATVFGESHECSVNPKPPANLPRFVPPYISVVPPEQPWETTLGPDEVEG